MTRAVDLSIAAADPADAAALAELHSEVARDLTARHGRGHWSGAPTAKGVLRSIAESNVLVARRGAEILGTLRLARKKPWAIDVGYFTPVPRPLYLLGMAVRPDRQRRGVGRRLLDAATEAAAAFPAQAIRLDTYDYDAGAGEFYARCGYRHTGNAVYRGTPHRYYELLLGGGAAHVCRFSPKA